MKISYKLILGYLLIALLASFTSYTALRSYQNIDAAFERLINDPLPMIKVLEDLRVAGNRIVSSTSELSVIYSETRFIKENQAGSEKENEENKAFEELESELAEEEMQLTISGYNQYEDALKRYENLIRTSMTSDINFLPEIRKNGDELKILSLQITEMKKKGISGEEILELKEKFEKQENAYFLAVDAALKNEYEQMTNEQISVHTAITNSTRTTYLVTFLTFLMAIGAGIYISRMIAKRITKLKEASENVGRGHLETIIEIKNNDEIGDLARAFNKMVGDLKKSHSNLSVAQNFTEKVLDSMVDFVVVVNMDLTISQVNRAALKINGYEEHELIGQSINLLMGDKPFNRKGIDILRVSGFIANLDKLNLNKDGSLTPISMSLSVLKDEEDKDLGIVCVGKDVSERKRAEETLRENEAKFRDLFDNAPVAYHELDTEGRFMRINHTEELLLGYSEAELIGRHLSEIIVEKASRETTAAKLSGMMPLQAVESTFIKNDGTLVSVLNEDRLIFDKHGNITGIRSTLQDITERKSLEEKLQRGQKLESIGQLAAGIAHEINTPTQYVGDNTRFLKDSFIDLAEVLKKNEELLKVCQDNGFEHQVVTEMEETIEFADTEYLMEEIPKAIEQSLNGIGRIGKIVQSMKDFAHPGSVDKRAIDLNRAIESTITVTSNEWKYVAEMVTDFDLNLPAVPCLIGEFNQVILNMIVNAAHAITDVVGDGSKGKGTIKISTKHKGDWVEISLSDTGAGINEENRKKIFDPFFTTKEIGKGTGQGLAISHTVIVEKHNGTIDVESEVGKGTTFIISLPVKVDSENIT